MSFLARASHAVVCPVAGDVTIQVNPTAELAGDIVTQNSLKGTIVSTKSIDPSCPPTNVTLGSPDPFVITAFSGNPSVLEIGVDLANPAFTAAYSQPATSVTLDDGENAQQVIPLPGLAFSGANSYLARTTPNEFVDFVLTAGDGIGAPDSSTRRTQWRARHWFGFHASPGPLTDAQVLAMAQLQTALSTNTTFDVTFAAVAGLYFHHVWHDFFLPLDPTKYFTDGLFNSGVTDVGPVAISSTPSAFTARNVRTGLLNTSGSPIRFERRA